ncbi:MAG: hypothetical protein KGH98_04225, partial [Candidatus Micrarchaeota archaeon]|nr:hypothetical protein [Candidatus Micrarchaeota archaeon]
INNANLSGLGNLTFSAYVNITPNVFKLGATPQVITSGIGEPADIYVTINNTGVSDSPFVISISGLPSWNESQTVIALHNTTREFVYPIYENEPGSYIINLSVSSQQSPLVHKQVSLSLVTQASLLNDWSAIGHGPVTFPIIYEPAYAIMYLISYIFKH